MASAVRMMVSAFGCKFANHTSGFFSILVVRAPIEPGCTSICLHKLTEFQQELLQVGAVLKGENVFTSFPDKVGKGMNVRQGKEYIDDVVKCFFEAGLYAKKMGGDEEQIVQMRPSLTTRPSKSPSKNP